MTHPSVSRTAIGASLMRALHTRTHPCPLFDDPWGDRLVPDAVKAQLHDLALARMDETPRAQARLLPPGTLLERGLLASPAFAGVVLRSRYAEDALADAVQRGIRQYVLLGAGLDSFSLRNVRIGLPVAVYELDLPATQAAKREWIAALAAPLAGNVHFVPTDLGAETVGDALRRSALDPAQPAFFSWLGVTMYLPRAANITTLTGIASFAAPGSELVFEYVDACELDHGTAEFSGLRAVTTAAGEPFLSGFDPATLQHELMRLGLHLLEDISGHGLMHRYPDGGPQPMHAHATQHLARARVMPTAC